MYIFSTYWVAINDPLHLPNVLPVEQKDNSSRLNSDHWSVDQFITIQIDSVKLEKNDVYIVLNFSEACCSGHQVVTRQVTLVLMDQ